MVESWLDSKKKAQNLDKVDTAYSEITQRTQRKNCREAMAAIRGLESSSLLEKLEGQLRFFDSHLSKSPEVLSTHERHALFSAVHELADTFGPMSYMTVYREWKSQQNIKNLNEQNEH